MPGALLQRIEAFLRRSSEAAAVASGALLVPLLLAALARWLLDYLGALHWSLELLGALGLAALVWLLLASLRGPALDRHSIAHPWSTIIAIFLTTAVLAVTVFSALSILLQRWQPASYDESTVYVPGQFADFYFWLLFDALPVLKLTSTYDIDAPMTAKTPLAATLVLLFRIFVIARLIDAGRVWWRSRRAARGPTPLHSAASATAY